MTGYPILVRGDTRALVVGGGLVAARKVRALLAAGLSVRVVAPRLSVELRALAAAAPGRCRLEERAYAAGDQDGATLVVAATASRAVNAAVAGDARVAGRLVNVVDAPEEGTFVTMAVHRSGALVVAVSAGVPRAAARIRDAIGRRFDARYAAVLDALARIRARSLREGERDSWHRALDALVTDAFCARVESGELADEVAAWR